MVLRKISFGSLTLENKLFFFKLHGVQFLVNVLQQLGESILCTFYLHVERFAEGNL